MINAPTWYVSVAERKITSMEEEKGYSEEKICCCGECNCSKRESVCKCCGSNMEEIGNNHFCDKCGMHD